MKYVLMLVAIMLVFVIALLKMAARENERAMQRFKKESEKKENEIN